MERGLPEVSPGKVRKYWTRNQGVDLSRYGKREKALYRETLANNECRLLICVRDWETYPDVHIIGFEYGPSPEDWQVYHSNWRDEFSGEFWNLVEGAGAGDSWCLG